jgi:hypothetical protein
VRMSLIMACELTGMASSQKRFWRSYFTTEKPDVQLI